MRASRTLLVLPLLGLAVSACTGKGIGWSAEGSAPPFANALPNLEFVTPAADLFVRPGDHFQIQFVSKDSDDIADVTILADQDGDPRTLADQFTLGTGHSDHDGQVQQVDVMVPQGVTLGSYSVLGSVKDAKNAAVRAQATGHVVVNAAPTLTVQAPATNVTVARGGLLPITFTATDPDDRAHVAFVADADGDPSTVADQYPVLSSSSDATGAPQTAVLDLTGVPVGTYQLIGIVSDGHPPAMTAAAAGRVTVANVALARENGGLDYEEGRALATFADGSWVVAGRFGGTALFGQWPNLINLNSAGDDDAFTARYRADGSLAWVTRAGGSSGDWANGVTALADGSCVVVGYFHGLCSFGQGSARVQISSLSEEDAFLARYDAAGNLLWVKSAGGPGRQVMNAVATLSDGSLAVTGCFERSITLGEGTAAVTLTAPGPFLSCDAFVARYTQNGALLWARQCGGATGDDTGKALAVLPDDAILLAGSFDTMAAFGQGSSAVNLLAEGGKDAFLACWQQNGTLQWAHRVGGGMDDEARSVCVLPDGSCVLTGVFRGTASFGEGTGLPTLTATGSGDLFLARYDAAGTLLWQQRAGGSGLTEGSSLAALPDGSTLLTGAFTNSATFGSVTLEAAGWPGAADIVLARYDRSGSLMWSKRAGGPDQDRGNAVAAFPDGSCVVTGVFTGTCVFGSGAGECSVFAFGWGDMFVARYNGDGEF